MLVAAALLLTVSSVIGASVLQSDSVYDWSPIDTILQAQIAFVSHQLLRACPY